MTRSQRELAQILTAKNKAAADAGRPWIKSTATLQQIAQATHPDAAARLVEGEKTGTPAFIDTRQTGDDDNPLEVFIWAAYMGTRITSKQTYNKDDPGDPWYLFRQALAELIEQESPFFKIAQSKATNALPALFKKDLQLDMIGNATAEAEGVEFRIANYENLAGGLRTQSYMLFDALLRKFTQTHSPTIELPLREYAELRGLSGSKDQLKDLRKEAVADLEVLAAISYRCKERIKGKLVDSGVIKINGGTAIIKNGIIRWNYNADLVPVLEKLPPADYSRETLKADPRTNQYYFSRYLDLNYRRNEGKDRVNVISVKTLLSKAQNLPKIEDVKKSRGSAKQKIITPFIRDLDNIERLDYYVMDESGQEISDPLALDYETFVKCSIRVLSYDDYPEHPERVRSRKKREADKKKA